MSDEQVVNKRVKRPTAPRCTPCEVGLIKPLSTPLRANHFCGNFFSFDDALAECKCKEKGDAPEGLGQKCPSASLNFLAKARAIASEVHPYDAND